MVKVSTSCSASHCYSTGHRATPLAEPLTGGRGDARAQRVAVFSAVLPVLSLSTGWEGTGPARTHLRQAMPGLCSMPVGSEGWAGTRALSSHSILPQGSASAPWHSHPGMPCDSPRPATANTKGLSTYLCVFELSHSD